MTNIDKKTKKHSFTDPIDIDDVMINAANNMYSVGNNSKSEFKIKLLSSDNMISAELKHISPDEIDLNFDGNKRDILHNDVSDLVELIKKTNGNTEPIYVRKHPDKSSGYRYQIVKGKRRTRACDVAGTKVEAIVADFNDDDAFDFATHENLGSMPLDNFELGDTLKAVIDSKKFTMTEAARLFKSKSGKALSRTGAYKIIECSSISNEIRKKILDKSSVSVNVIIRLKNALSFIYEGYDAKEVADYLDTLEPLEGRDLVRKLMDKFSIEDGDEKKAVDFINDHEGKILLNKKGVKVASIASLSSGAPLVRFTKEVDKESYDRIVRYIQEQFER